MDPFYQAPQEFDIFSDPELLGELGVDFGQIEDLPPELLAQVPEPELNWQQKMANAAAGGLFPQASQNDRDAAIPAARRAFAAALMKSALAKDKRGAAEALAEMFPDAHAAFRQELGGIVKSRNESEDRAYAGERRDFEREGMKETRDDRAREGSSRTARIGSAAAIRSAFELAMQDDDVVKSGKAGALSSAFESAMAELEVSGSAEALKAVRDLATAAASLANKSEDFDLGLSQAQQETAVKGGFGSVEEWLQREAKEREDADRRAGLSEQSARASIWLTNLSAAEKKAEIERRKNFTPPEGFMEFPDGSYRDVTPKGSGTDPRAGLIKSFASDADFREWMAGKPNETGSMYASMVGAETPEEFMAISKEVFSPKGSGSAAPPAPAGKTVSSSSLAKIAAKRGTTVEAERKRAEEAGYSVTD